MPFSDIISRTDSAGEIPAQIAEQIIGNVSTTSTALTLGRRVPTTTKDSKIPVLTSIPDAYWLTGDTGLKQTSSASWENKSITAEEIAVVVPVPDSVVADANFDLWAAVSPLIARAFARRVDRAVLFGQESPASWPAGLVQQATTAANVVDATADPVLDLLSAAEQVANVEHTPTAAVVRTGWQYAAGRSRAEVESIVGNPVAQAAPFPLMVAGLPIATDPVMWNRDAAEAIVADWSCVLMGVRQDITFELFNTGVIQDDTGKIVYNLMQQDMSALRAVMRVGYMLATPVTGSGEAGVPVSVVAP